MGISRFGLYPALKLSLTVSAGLPLGYLHRSQASTNLEDNIYTKFYELQRSLYPTWNAQRNITKGRDKNTFEKLILLSSSQPAFY